MTKAIIYSIIVFLSLACVAFMLYKMAKQRAALQPTNNTSQLVLSGILAFIADTLGLGSFAVNIALAKLLNTFNDEELPGMTNGAQVIPGAIEALFFLSFVQVELKTLITLIIGTSIGGLIGGYTVAHLHQQTIRLSMVLGFFIILCLLICNEFHWLPLTGESTELGGLKLAIGFFAMILCGSLTSVGVGLFVSTQAVLFLLNVSPLVAFPIMTTAGAIQQPLTTFALVANDKVPLKKTLILSLSGLIGVAISIPLFSRLSITWLHYLLTVIITFNMLALGKAFWQHRKMPPAAKTDPNLELA